MSETLPQSKIHEEAGQLNERFRTELGQSLIDMDNAISLILTATIAGGHALLEGVPGTAKTTLCRCVASVLGMDFRRIQFTPDLLPSDVTGTKIFDQATSKFELQRGPIFCQLLLADELNRAPARTQSALLEGMQERQVTIEGETIALPNPFIVLATQNPVEQEGVYRLPEAQLDRFIFRVTVGYPRRDSEIDLLEIQEKPPAELKQLCTPEQILRLQSGVDTVFGSKELKAYIVDLIRGTREHEDVLLGASPRASIYLMRAARTRALLRGNPFFTHEDVQAMAIPVLEHRVIIRPESELSGRQTGEVIEEIIQKIPVLK